MNIFEKSKRKNRHTTASGRITYTREWSTLRFSFWMDAAVESEGCLYLQDLTIRLCTNLCNHQHCRSFVSNRILVQWAITYYTPRTQVNSHLSPLSSSAMRRVSGVLMSLPIKLTAKTRGWNRENVMMKSCFDGECHPVSHAHDGFIHFPQAEIFVCPWEYESDKDGKMGCFFNHLQVSVSNSWTWREVAPFDFRETFGVSL